MAVQSRKLDRKARTAIAVAVALLFAGPVILTVKHVMSKFGGTPQAPQSDDDQLVMLQDGSTMLVRHGSTGRIMANWLKEDSTGGVKKFDVGNENFTPASATLTNEGWEHLAQFAQMLKAHHEVSADILYSAHHAIPATVQLEHQRADRIRDEALNQGVGADQVSVVQEGYAAGHNAAGDEGLEVVLTNHG